MRTEIERIVDQVHRSFWGEAWHGPSVSESLKGVDANMASAHPIVGAHSIADLAAHLELTQRVVLQRVVGHGPLISGSAGFPPVPSPISEADWADLLKRLREGATALEAAIGAFPVERLDEPLVRGGSAAFNNFLGHAQHNIYHAGQIRLIRKLASSSTSGRSASGVRGGDV